MAEETVNSGNGTPDYPVGQVFVAMGEVRAIAPDGTVRLLEPNSPVFFNEKIITGGDGRVSVVFQDQAQTMLSLGRNSEFLIDEDVIEGAVDYDISDAISEVEDIQQALADDSFDPTVILPPPGAGPQAGNNPANDGGGSSYPVFTLTGEEVIPDSGAETIGVEGNFLDPPLPTTPPEGPVVLDDTPTRRR